MKTFSLITALIFCFFTSITYAENKLFSLEPTLSSFSIKNNTLPASRIKLQSNPEFLYNSMNFEIDLPNIGEVSLYKTGSEKMFDGTPVWKGQIAGDPHSIVVFMQTKDGFAGEIIAGGRTYRVFKSSGSYQLVTLDRDPKQFGVDYWEVEAKKSGINTMATPTPIADNFVDILVMYSDDVAAVASSALTAQTMVSAMNQMLENSCANFRLRAVYIGSATYTETNDTSSDLTALVAPADGNVDTAHTLRDATGADLVHFIVSSQERCGLAQVPTPGSFDDSIAFGVSPILCAVYNGFGHEVGHNLGVRHDRLQSGIGFKETTSSLDGYGYVDLANKYLSVMAYNDHCSDNGLSCQWISKYSNPDIHHNGVAFGVKGYSDAVSAMNNNYPHIAGYRNPVTSFDPDINLNCTSATASKSVHCFVATATFGTYLHPQINTLRKFRDTILKKNALGRWLTKKYYKYSPYWAYKIENSKFFKTISVAAIASLIFTIKNWSALSLALLLFASFFVFYRLRKNAHFTQLLLFAFATSQLLNMDAAQAQIANDQVINNRTNTNPALVRKTNIFSLKYSDLSSEAKPNALLADEEKGNPAEIFINYNYSGVGIELSYIPTWEKTLESTQAPLAKVDFNTDVSETKLSLSYGGIPSLPFGVSYRILELEDKDINETTTLNELNFGARIPIWAGFNLGGGAKYVTETGTSIADATWLGQYLGVGYTKDNLFSLELGYERQPEVIQIEGSLSNIRGQKETISVEVGIPLGHMAFALRYDTDNTKGIENRLIDPTGSSTSGLGFLYNMGPFGYTLDYSQNTQDKGKKKDETLIVLGFSYNMGASAAASPAPAQ